MALVTGQTLPPTLAATRIHSGVVAGEGRGGKGRGGDEMSGNRQDQLWLAVNKQIMCVSVIEIIT